ncbi:MAG: hypothetical protein WCX28_14730 [Bacteriovoracaceae bacterium]
MTILALLIFTITDSSALRKGDECFRAQDYAGAMTAYTSYAKTQEHNAGVYWRIARTAICSGDISDPDTQEVLYRKALEAATHSVRLDSLSSNAQCWYAISLGYIALFEGSKTKVEYCRQIQSSLDAAIRLDPCNDVAYSVYGTFYRMLGNVNWIERQLADLLLGGLPKGGFAEAEVMLKKAIALAPNVLRHRFELGMLYYETERIQKGEELFRLSLLIPPTLASDKERITTMKQMLGQSAGK